MKEDVHINPDCLHADAYERVSFCLKQLDADLVHSLYDEAAPQLTYEELIGALIAARHHLRDYP